ncbi:hypothetical protein [Myxococcus sp. Y35]|uniref:hypothetical protein n=1 Tax=Pseudomyxococcus flavus TaxID=3115648 RepID=UPI003CEBABFD
MRTLILLVVCGVLGTARMAHADEGKLRFDPVSLLVGKDVTKVELEPKYDSDGDNFNGWLLGGKVKIPATKVEGSAQAALLEFNDAWALGPVIGKQFSGGDPEENSWKFLLQGECELGLRTFKYFPGAGEEDEKSTRLSFAPAATALFWKGSQTREFAFQARIRYAREWKEAKAVGIVTPGSEADGTPALVKEEKIVDQPSVTPALTGLMYGYTRSGSSNVAFGLALKYTTTGTKELHALSKGPEVFRPEFWVYYLPSDVKPANLRLGVGAYADLYTRGEAEEDVETYGLLLQVKWGTPVFAY